MNRDEFAFFNDQLAAMLRSGIPLEGALRQLASGMRQGVLRTELQALEADLTQGRPLREAIGARQLPELYRRLVITGAEGGDLPGLLTLAADHFHETAHLQTRLQGLMVYPLLALATALAVSLILANTLGSLVGGGNDFAAAMELSSGGIEINRFSSLLGLWTPPLVLSLLGVLLFLALVVPEVRHRLRWRLPAFREASLAQLAASITVLLRAGTRLPDAVALAADLEPSRAAARELKDWQARLARGERMLAHPDRRGLFPPLFQWLVTSEPENALTGFARAADVFRRRARARAETLLYAALPVMILFLGGIVLGQAAYSIRLIYTTVSTTLGGFVE